MAKDSGFAVIYHMMPGLPGSDIKKDLKTFKTIFENHDYKPDALKIYPTLVLPDTKLYQMWKKGEYKPYEFEDMVNLIVEIKKLVPKWVRIQRIQRDIPLNLVAAGMNRGDLRMVVQKRLKEEKLKCNCIRCREVGHYQYKSNLKPNLDDIELKVEKYHASEGEELFITFEDFKKDVLIGLLRLRKPSEKAFRSELKNKNILLVRELHVFGPTVKVGKQATEGQWQHRGWGENLMKEAERIAIEEYDAKHIAVLAGIGTRNYYRRFGYKLTGPYMVKEI
jgi:elongator complex protein 3